MHYVYKKCELLTRSLNDLILYAYLWLSSIQIIFYICMTRRILIHCVISHRCYHCKLKLTHNADILEHLLNHHLYQFSDQWKIIIIPLQLNTTQLHYPHLCQESNTTQYLIDTNTWQLQFREWTDTIPASWRRVTLSSASLVTLTWMSRQTVPSNTVLISLGRSMP